MERAPRLKLPLSVITSENFLSALRILGSEKLPIKISYRIGRTIKDINGHIDEFHRAKVESIKKHGAVEVAKLKCPNPGCSETLVGQKDYDLACKCGRATVIPSHLPTFWQIPPEDKNAITAFSEELDEALTEEVEIFLDAKLKFADLEGVKIPPLAVQELLPILAED